MKLKLMRKPFERREMMKKPIHERLTEKNNGLTKAQEVLYQRDFKQAKETAKNIEHENKINM